MDSYQATLVQEQADGNAHDVDHDGSDDHIEHDAPIISVVQDERRMQVRAYNHWTSLLGARNFPGIEDLALGGIPDFSRNAVVLDFSDGIDDPTVAMLGERLAQECGATKAIERLSDVPGRSLLSQITEKYRQILTNQAPIGFEAEFVNLRDRTVVYRGILLPFSSDGANIQHIMGVINWKELADPVLTAGLIQELDGAGAAYQWPVGAPLVEWADGPASIDADCAVLADPDVTGWQLADWLTSARELAAAERRAQDLARAALYAAIGRAWDLALAAQIDPCALNAASAGLKVRACKSMAELVKLVLGAHYDRDRLAEFTAALTHAQRLDLGQGELADYLAGVPGGLKGVVQHERTLRRVTTREIPARPS